jgi:archaellum component FlaF (FlaF/FlaG flagellin family)
MALEKQILVDKIEVVNNGSVQVRSSIVVLEDGKEISNTFHRNVIAPGQDYRFEDKKVRDICSAVHTAETIAKYEPLLI